MGTSTVFGGALACALLLSACGDPAPTSGSDVALQTVRRDAALARQALLADGSERDSIHSPSNTIWTDSMLAFKPLSDSTFEITNWVPTGLSRITVTLRFDGAASTLLLLRLDSIAPHERLTLPYPRTSRFRTADGRTAELEGAWRFAPTGVRLHYLGDSPRLARIRDITAHWRIRFHDYAKEQPTHPSWNPVRPAQARMITALMMNAAYLFSRPDYKALFLRQRFYRDIVDSTREVPDSAWFVPAQTAALYDALQDRVFEMGIVGGGGLGGGWTLGVDNGTLTDQFSVRWHDSLLTMDYLPESHYSGPHPLLSHEIGHCLGYGHNSNVCSTGRMGPVGTPGWSRMYGFPSLSTMMHARYVAYGLLPCLQEDYYRPDDFSYRQPAWGGAY